MCRTVSHFTFYKYEKFVTSKKIVKAFGVETLNILDNHIERLKEVEGIGEKKAKALLSALTFSEIRQSGVDELSKIKGISERDARRIYEYYHKEDGGEK